MCAIWDVPSKNNDDESNIDATFQANLFRSLFYQKWKKEMIATGKECKQHNV